jgi:RNA recognition motif-containing protein
MNFFFFNLMEDWRQFWKRLSRSGGPVGETRRLYVGNLSYNAKEEDLKSLFAGSAKVADVHLIRDRFTRKPKGYAFVEVAKDDAQKALTLSGSDFLGRKLVVSEAKSKGPGGPGAPPRRNRSEHRGGGGGGERPRGRRRPMKGPRAYKPGPQQMPTPQGKEAPPQVERLE